MTILLYSLTLVAEEQTKVLRVSVSVVTSCSVSNSEVIFDKPYDPTKDNYGFGIIPISCQNGTKYILGIDQDNSDLENSEGDILKYGLYKDPQGKNFWGDGEVGVPYTGVGSNTKKGLNVYGIIPAGQKKTSKPESYTDTDYIQFNIIE